MSVRALITSAAVAVFVCLPAVPGAAAAAKDLVLVTDSNKVTLEHQDGGTATASITLENQAIGTGEGVAFSVDVVEGAAPGCKIDPPGDHTVDWQRQQTFELTFSAACKPDRAEGTDFTVTGDDGSSFALHADQPASPSSDWRDLLAGYLMAGLVSAVVLIGAWLRWKATVGKTVSRTGSIDRKLPLPGLDADWKFSDSWAANATVVTTAFAGVFGAKEVATTLLGADADAVQIVALVAAAISLGLVGISPMVLQGLRKQSPGEEAVHKTVTKDMPAGLYVTPMGLLIAGFLTLTATLGQLGALLQALIDTDFGNDTILYILWVASFILVSWYAWQATKQNLTTGATLPPADPEEEEKTTGRLRAALAGAESGVTAVLVEVPAAAQRRPAGIL